VTLKVSLVPHTADSLSSSACRRDPSVTGQRIVTGKLRSLFRRRT
jgi:hypothetical protein